MGFLSSDGRRALVVGLAASLALTTVAVVPAASATAASAEPSPQAAAPAAAAATAADIVRITFDGTSFSPFVTRAEPGTPLLFVNEGGFPISIEEGSGAFSLSPIPSGGGGAVTWSEAGALTYRESATGANGHLVFGLAAFPGAAPTDLANDSIPDAWPPLEADESFTVDASDGVSYSTSRLYASFTDSASAADVEAALARAGALVIGGSPTAHLAALTIADLGDHAVTRSVVAQLEAEPSIASVTRSQPSQYSVLPEPVDRPDHVDWTNDPLLGDGYNSGQEAAGLPQLWNFGETLRRATSGSGATTVTTSVWDGGFQQEHPDLDALRRTDPVCADDLFGLTSVCTKVEASNLEHGMHVTGIVGARQAGDRVGYDGVNPVADIVGVNPGGMHFGLILDTVLDLKQAGDSRFEDLRVINLSMSQTPTFAVSWAEAHRDPTCGPGVDDDDLPGTDFPCLPWTLDSRRSQMRTNGLQVVPVLQRAAALGVTIAHSAGNEADQFCMLDGQLYGTEVGTPCPDGSRLLTAEENGVPTAAVNSRFAAASDMWLPAWGPNPVVVVESLGRSFTTGTTERSRFSQTEGFVSAQGYHLSLGPVDKDGNPTWRLSQGTSQASPTVAGILGAMLALDPSMTVQELRDAIQTFDDATDPTWGLDVAPRIDAFGSMLAVDGGLLALLDVSDPSADGNRRVVYGPGGSIGSYDIESSTEPGYLTEPDGVVDLRDFRRVRDAWLQGCPSAGTPDCSVLTTVPVALDGLPDHPKRDLNFDGCVATDPPSESCPAAESIHPRFDFNGDGKLSRTATHPVNIGGVQEDLTDLEVMARLFEPDPTGEGWNADTADVPLLLEGLLVSGDIEVALGGLLGAGATDVAITLRESGVDVFRRPLAASEESVVITAHADRPVEIVVQGTKDGAPFEYSESFDLDAGEDVRYDPCGVIRLEGSDPLIAFESTATVTATLVGCDAADMSGVNIDVITTRATGGSDATVDSPITTAADGTASSTFTSGLVPGLYTVTATADLPTEAGPTTPVESSLLIEVTEGYRYTTIVEQPDGILGFPSLNDEGTVVFASRADPTGPRNQVNRHRLDALTEIGETLRGATDAGIDINSVDITNDDYLLVQGDNFGAGLPVSETHQWAGEVHVRFPTIVEVFGESSFFSPLDMSGQPAGNVNGDRIMPVHRAGEVGTRVGAYNNGTLAEGPQLGADWVRHADNGYTIGLASIWSVATNAGDTFFSTAIVIGDSNFGVGTDPDKAFLVPLAVENAPDAVTPTDWTLLGDRPDISSTGDVVAFVGDRGDGPAVFVALRANDEGSFYAPVPITGPGRTGPPELGFDGATPRHLEIDTAAGDHDLNVGVIHHQLGREGLDDDYATVAVFGDPDGPGTPYSGGLYTIDVSLTSSGAIAASGVHPVVELGDTQVGATVERIGWHRVLADDETSTDPAEHQLAFWVDTPAGERIVRADWVGGGGSSGVTASFAAPLAARSAPTALAAPMPALASADPPAVPAVIVSDLTPEVGEVITVTNRTPRRSQYDSGWLLFEFPDGQRWSPRSGESLSVRPPAGEYTVEFNAGVGFSTFVPFVVSPSPGVPPTADAGGPYLIESGDRLELDASGSSDTDGTIVLYEWDLDLDGEFDDATGPSPRIDYAEVEDLLCNRLCSNPPGGGIGSKGINLRVTDDAGYSAVATGSVSITVVVQDFSISLLPATELINPGGQTNLRVDVGSVGGFSDRVTLELISPIPDGYSIFVDPWVDPPGSGNLVVRAPADAPEETFDIQIRGTSGALVHETSASAEAVFGLIPICYSSVSGVVTDAVTGLPVADMPMRLQGLGTYRSTTTAADGTYTYDNIRELTTFTIEANPDDTYFRVSRNGQIRCDDPLTLDLEVVPIQTTIVRGQVVEGIPDPTDTSRGRAIAATAVPIPDPTLSVANKPATGGPDGRYSIDVELGRPDNRGFLTRITGHAPGFWQRTIDDIRIEAGPAVTVDLPLVRACTTQLGAHGRVVDQFGNPMSGLTVRLNGSGGPSEAYPYIRGRQLGTAVTDDDGYYAIPVAETYLDFQNSVYRFEVSTNYGYTARTIIPFGLCDTTFDAEADIEVNVPDPTEPVYHYATVTGRVVDAVTGEPIENARVAGRRTGPDGRFTKNDIYVGTDQYTVRTDVELIVQAPAEWYGETVTGVAVAKDTVTDVGDIPLIPAEFARIEGYVVDVLTGEPLRSARVTVDPDFGSPNTFTLNTDENGYYVRERIKLPAYNEPRTARIEAVRTLLGGKYFREHGGEIPLVPGETTRTDFALTKVCEDVTVRGYVVDAVTGAPIQGASVDTPVTPPRYTDEFGFYEFTGLTAGSYNQPGAYLLTASATGYYTQQKLVNVACGSVITVNFGADTGAGAVFGIVTDHLGNPVLDAQVIAETGDTDTADATGAYRIEEIPLGLDGEPTEWNFTAVHPDGRTIVLPATVSDGGETELNFVFPEPVDPPNVAPLAYDRSAFVIGGESVDITLVGTDADGDDLTFEVVTQPGIGTLDGTAPDLTYLAPIDGDGDVTFTYTVSDGEDTSAPATVTVTIEPPNRPPTADDLTATVIAGESVDITLTGSDLDGDPLTFEVVTQPAVGSLSGDAPDLSYQAPSDVTGEVTFTYTAFDGEVTSAPATVTIDVQPVAPNTPPEADDIFEQVTAGESVDITLSGSDADGDPLTFEVVTQPAVGTLSGDAPDLSYQAPFDVTGEVTFTYTAFDGEDTSQPATVTVIVEEPLAFASVYGTVTDDTGAPVLDAVVFSDAVPWPGFVEPDGHYFIPDILVPSSGDPIEVFFTAFHPDGREITSSATLTADTETELNFVFPSDGGSNTPPTADDLSLEVVAGESVAVTLSGDDADGDPLDFEVLTQPAFGVLSGLAPVLSYLAPDDMVGEVSFTYAAFDGEDLSLPATVTITVLPRPDTAPTLDPIDDITLDEGDSLQIGVTADDAEGHPVSLSAISAPGWVGFVDAGGGSGTLTLEPLDDAFETVVIEACANGLCSTTSFDVTVDNVDPELVIDAPASTVVDTAVSVTGATTDPGDDEWSYQIDCGAGFGPFQPDPQFDCTLDTIGPVTVSMRVVDDDGGEGTASAVIQVTAALQISVSASNDGPAPWGTDVVLTATSDASGLTEPIVYWWDVDGDGVYDTAVSSDATLVTQYASPGSWPATVEACAGDLCATGGTTVEVVRRPSALSTPAGGPVQYSDTATIETTLTDALDATPLAGRDVTVGVDGGPTGAVSDAAGVAAVTWLATVEAGSVPLTAAFDGDELYESAAAAGDLEVVPEDAVLDWLTRPATPAENYDVAVMVSESADGELGDIGLASVTFWLDEGCDGNHVPVGTFPVVDGAIAGDGVGEVVATIPGLAGPGCVGADLTTGDAGPNGYYTAAPLQATVADLADGHVTGGGRFDTSDGWVSVGFVARRQDGVLSGHVEVVEHADGVVQHRSIAITGLTIVDEGDAGVVATITAEFLERTPDSWIGTTLALIALDGGRGRGVDSVWWEGGPPRIEGSFRGQVVVHR